MNQFNVANSPFRRLCSIWNERKSRVSWTDKLTHRQEERSEKSVWQYQSEMALISWIIYERNTNSKNNKNKG